MVHARVDKPSAKRAKRRRLTHVHLYDLLGFIDLPVNASELKTVTPCGVLLRSWLSDRVLVFSPLAWGRITCRKCKVAALIDRMVRGI